MERENGTTFGWCIDYSAHEGDVKHNIEIAHGMEYGPHTFCVNHFDQVQQMKNNLHCKVIYEFIHNFNTFPLVNVLHCNALLMYAM